MKKLLTGSQQLHLKHVVLRITTFFWRFLSTPHSCRLCVSVCWRSGGVSSGADADLATLPSRNKLKKSIHASRKATYCQTDHRCLANVPVNVCDTQKVIKPVNANIQRGQH